MNMQAKRKRAFWKAIRQTKIPVIEAQLEDRFTLFDEEVEEASNCTLEHPCRFCLREDSEVQHARNTHYAGAKVNAH